MYLSKRSNYKTVTKYPYAHAYSKLSPICPTIVSKSLYNYMDILETSTVCTHALVYKNARTCSRIWLHYRYCIKTYTRIPSSHDYYLEISLCCTPSVNPKIKVRVVSGHFVLSGLNAMLMLLKRCVFATSTCCSTVSSGRLC